MSYYGLVWAVVEFFKTGTSPVPLDETLEIMAFMEAADLSKSRKGAPVAIAEILKRGGRTSSSSGEKTDRAELDSPRQPLGEYRQVCCPSAGPVRFQSGSPQILSQS